MIAIIIIGPPGSGKGTQAELLAKNSGLIHLDTGVYLEQVVYNSQFKNNKKIQRERKLFETGKLLTPSWVLEIVSQKIKELAKAKVGVVLSGSPRTLYEVIGDKNHLGVIKILEINYGKKNIFIFELKIPSIVSIKRNSGRLLCSVCGIPILSQASKNSSKNCPFCGGKLRKRVLDKPEIIKIRLKEYESRTKPIIEELKKRNYKIAAINGTPLPYKVHKKIIGFLK